MIRPYVMAGPTVGYLLRSNIELDAFGLTFQGDMSEVTKHWDFGLGLGGGVSFSLDMFTLFVEGRYTLGMTNLQKGGSFNVVAGSVAVPIDFDKDEDWYKNRGIQILAGVTISITDRS